MTDDKPGSKSFSGSLTKVSDPEKNRQARIVVVGVGGAGCSAINNMIEQELAGVEFIAMDTDTQNLEQSLAEAKVQLGVEATEGFGAGSDPGFGKAAAVETAPRIESLLKDAHMVLIAAGMVGGTGTGGAPEIARVSREMGILTVGIVTRPFQYELRRRTIYAEEGISEMQQFVDTLIVIPNENLLKLEEGPQTFNEAFAYADNVLLSGVRGITDLIVQKGRINLDFNDIKTVLKNQGNAVMGTGEAAGEERAREAALKAINNPLLEEINLHGASKVLVNITAASDLGLREPSEAIECITADVSEDALVIFGVTFNEELGENIRVSLIATGVNETSRASASPVVKPEKVPQAGSPTAFGSAAEPSVEQDAKPSAAPAQPEIVAQPEVVVVPETGQTGDDSEPGHTRVGDYGLFAPGELKSSPPDEPVAALRTVTREGDAVEVNVVADSGANDQSEAEILPKAENGNGGKGFISPLAAFRSRSQTKTSAQSSADGGGSGARTEPNFLRR